LYITVPLLIQWAVACSSLPFITASHRDNSLERRNYLMKTDICCNYWNDV